MGGKIAKSLGLRNVFKQIQNKKFKNGANERNLHFYQLSIKMPFPLLDSNLNGNVNLALKMGGEFHGGAVFWKGTVLLWIKLRLY